LGSYYFIAIDSYFLIAIFFLALGDKGFRGRFLGVLICKVIFGVKIFFDFFHFFWFFLVFGAG
jgi:hypothetical protein